jgi:hypothetical protein
VRIDTVLKRIRTSVEYLENGELAKAYKLLKETEEKLTEDIEKKRNKKKNPEVKKLIEWYENLWNGEPPELLRFSEPRKVIGRHFKDLLKIYENNNLDVEVLKMEYEAFKDANPKLIGWKRKLLGDRGIVQFKYVLPRWKGTTRTESKKWTTPENERGLDYYTSQTNDIEF